MESQTFPVNSISEEWRQLLQDALGKEEGAVLAASLGCREVVFNVPTAIPDDEQPLGEITQKSVAGNDNEVAVVEEPPPDSVLHIVAAAGDSESHLKCARMIYGKASHLLTTAEASNSKGDTPLHYAARAKNTKMVACLIELAKGVNGIDYDKARDLVRMQNYKRRETALHEAIRFDNAEMVQNLLYTDKVLAQIDAKDGTSPLYLACTLGLVHIVELILRDKNMKTSYSGPRGQNALHAAVLHDNKEITGLLLKWNKDLVKQKDTGGSTPLHFAASAPDRSLLNTVSVYSMNFKISYRKCFNFLPPRNRTEAFERLKLPVTQLLATDPTSAFEADNDGSFPVHIAASADGMVSLIVLLTRYPDCARLRNAEGKTFLHVAVEETRHSVVKFVCLLWGHRSQFRSVVNMQDHKGNTALHHAVLKGDLSMSRYLISNQHVHINLENEEGKTPMDLAAGAVKSGFYFGVSAPRRILSMLTFAKAKTGSHRRDRVPEYSRPRLMNTKEESQKIKDFAQIVGIGSVLVATATFAAAITIPGGVWSPGDSSTATGKKLVASPPLPMAAGTPLFAGQSYAFDGFVISNTLAFMCSTLATFSLVYCGVAAVDLYHRLKLVTFSLAMLLCSARSFCAAFTFALYLLLAKVEHGTAIASIVMTSFALLDGIYFLLASNNDLAAVLRRRTGKTVWVTGPTIAFLVNALYPFWPYVVIGGYMLLCSKGSH